MSFRKSGSVVIAIGLIIGLAGILILLPSDSPVYESDVELEPGVFLFRGSLEGTGDFQIHSIRVLENPLSFHVILKCGGNDFDVYGGLGYTPTEFDYEFRGYEAGGEDLVFDYPEEGIWHFMVHSYSGSGQYELRIDIAYE